MLQLKKTWRLTFLVPPCTERHLVSERKAADPGVQMINEEAYNELERLSDYD